MVELWKSEGRDYTTQHLNQVQIICCTHKKNITVLPLDYCCRDPKGMVNKEKHYYYLWNAMESAKRCFGRYVLPHSPDNLWWQALSVPLHKHRPCQFPATASFCCLRECAVQWSEYPLLNTKSWNLLASYLSMWVHMLLQNILWSCTFHEKIRPSLFFFFSVLPATICFPLLFYLKGQGIMLKKGWSVLEIQNKIAHVMLLFWFISFSRISQYALK